MELIDRVADFREQQNVEAIPVEVAPFIQQDVHRRW